MTLPFMFKGINMNHDRYQINLLVILQGTTFGSLGVVAKQRGLLLYVWVLAAA
jgi:hypothetical protein